MRDEGRERTLLVVEDDETLRVRMARALRDRGFAVSEAGSVAEATADRSEPLDAALVDLRLPDGSGLSVVEHLVAAHPGVAIVVLTGYGSIATALEAVRLGARHYLTKPADVDQILAALEGGEPHAVPESQVPSLARVEWEHIQRVLQDCGGNISQAARVLGLHRRSLQRKLSKYPTAR
jgi:two-component system response regulator RegA